MPAGKKKTGKKKPFFDHNIVVKHTCKKCGHKEEIVKRVTGRWNILSPASPAEKELLVESETVKTINDFTKTPVKK